MRRTVIMKDTSNLLPTIRIEIWLRLERSQFLTDLDVTFVIYCVLVVVVDS